ARHSDRRRHPRDRGRQRGPDPRDPEGAGRDRGGGRAVIFGLLQVGLGVVLFALAYALGGFAWLLAWPAWSVAGVCAGCLGLGPRVCGMRAQAGSLRTRSVLLLLP